MTAPICEYWSYDLVLCCCYFKEILLQFIGIGIKFIGSMMCDVLIIFVVNTKYC